MKNKAIRLFLIVFLNLWGWERNGNPVCQAPGDQFNILAEPLTNKRIVVAWLDRRGGENTTELYLQVIDSLGNPLFTKDGIRVCDASGSKRTPNIATDGENIYLVWVDHRVSVDQFDIYMEKIDGLTGEREFDPSGLPISTGPATEKDPQIALDGSGEGCFLAWMDYRSGDADVRLAHISPEGKKKFEVAVCSLPGGQGTSVVVPSGEECLVFWGDSRDSLPGVYGQRITKNSPSGQWEPDGKLIIPFHSFENLSLMEENPYFFPYALGDGQGGAILYNPFYGTEIWQRVDSLGNLLWAPPPDMINPYQTVANKASGAIGCWGGGRGFWYPHFFVYVVQIDSSGNSIWGEGLIVWEGPEDTARYDTYPTLTDDSHRGAVVTWVQSDYTGNNLLISRVDSLGKVIWNPPTIISDSPYEKAHPFVIKGPNKGYIVVYEENHPNTGWDIMADYVDSAGRKGVEETDDGWKIPDDRVLSVTPDPFEEQTVVSFQLSAKAMVSFRVYDINGRLVKTLTRARSLEPGIYTVRWDGMDNFGRELPSGIYFYQLEIDGGRYKTLTEKIVLIRKEEL